MPSDLTKCLPRHCTMQTYQETSNFPISLLPLIALLPLLISKCLSQYSPITEKRPPSPPRLPLIGNLHQLGTYPYRSLQTLSQKNGDLILLHLGSKPTIFVSSAELASQILKTHDIIFASRPKLKYFRRLLGNGNDIVSSPYGESWRKMKSVCVHELLSKKKVESYRKVREEEVGLLVKEIKRLRVVNLSDMFRSLSNDLICRVAFGRKYREDDKIGVDFPKLLSDFVELLGGPYVGDFVSWLGWIDRVNGVNDKVNKVATTFDRFIETILEERVGVEDEKCDREKVKDFVDVLLEVQRRDPCRNRVLDKACIKGIILDIFAAATEATYIALEWMMSELVKNPRVMEELHKEIAQIVGTESIVTEDDIPNMHYLKAVFKETLRLHPPGPFLVPHESTHDVQIGGYHIPSATQVVVNAWSICRDPRYWKQPESFNPDRFLNSPRCFKGHDFEFIPFGSGRRMCPGMGFATTMVELVIANLVHRFDWSLLGGLKRECLDIKEASGLVMHKKDPLIVVASPRM